MIKFQFTYTRIARDGTILEHVSEAISAHTAKSAKLTLVKRFSLQNWTPWRRTESGNLVKTRTAHDYHGKIILELPVTSNQ